MAKIKEMDLTSGPIFKKLTIYAIPFIFTNILQILFSATDIAVLGIMVNDNAVAAVDWTFYVIYYSDDPRKVNAKPFEIAADLKAAGFVQIGKGNDILSDEKTHSGWAMEFTYSEKQ